MSQTPSPIDSLRDILRPDQIVMEKVNTISYACDGTVMLREVPDIVVFPDSVEQVVALVRWASRTGTPLVTRGSGSEVFRELGRTQETHPTDRVGIENRKSHRGAFGPTSNPEREMRSDSSSRNGIGFWHHGLRKGSSFLGNRTTVGSNP